MSAPREARKTVTVLFCDLVHSTGLAEGDPEAYRRVQSRYFEEMREIVERHGGTVEKFIGDEVMAVFGVPASHEDDALRAVRAAQAMQEVMPALGLEARIGINTGEVLVGDPTQSHGYLAGEPVIVAKRLEQGAAPGEIVIGKATYPLVENAVTAGPLERIPVKGKREDVGRHRIDDVDAEAPGVARRLHAPIVGRDEELGLLRGAFDRVVDEQACRLFTVLGAAGIGKSRLAAELISSVSDQATTAVGRCLPYGEGITYWPLTEVAQTLGDGAVSDAVHDDRSSEETFWAVRRAFEGLASRRPLVLCFEDLHWAEPTFLDLVEYVAGWSRGAPILILALARPELVEQRPAWIAPQLHSDALALEPLSEPETESLLAGLSDELQLSSGTWERIAAAAEGNPLFIEQMAALASEDGEGELSTPSSIQALLAERLDRLTTDEREVLERASVIGRDFPVSALAGLSSGAVHGSLTSQLFSLVRKGLIQPDPASTGDEDRFSFQHVLVRDAAYEAMPKQLRAELHERVAGAIEEGDELIGYHLEQAFRFRVELGETDTSLADRAAGHLASAGRRAMGRGDAAGATGLLRRAAELSQAAPDRRRAILSDLGAALRDSGELAASEEALSQAIVLAREADDPGLEAHAVIERAFTRLHMEAGLDEVRDLAETTLPTLVELGDDAGIAKALTLSGMTEYARCRVSSGEALLERALAHAEHARDRRQVRTILTRLAKTNLDGPRPAEDAIARTEGLARRFPDDRVFDALISSGRAPLEAMRGNFDEARRLYQGANAALEDFGASLTLAMNRVESGTVEQLAGDPEAAERELRAGLEVLDAMGETAVQASIAALLGQALLAQGRLEEAEKCAALSESMCATEDVFAQVEWRTLRAAVEAASGAAAQAERFAREAVELMQSSDALNLAAEAHAALGQALRAAGKDQEAAASLEEAAHLFNEKGNRTSSSRLRESSA